MVVSYLWEEMWRLLALSRIWLQWESKGLFTIDENAKSYALRKLIHQTTQNRVHKTVGFSSSEVRILNFLYDKRNLEPHYKIIFLWMRVADTSLLRDKMPPFWRVFHSVFSRSLYISLINRKLCIIVSLCWWFHLWYIYVILLDICDISLHFLITSLFSFPVENNLDHVWEKDSY